LNHFLDLLIRHLPGKPVDRDVNPVTSLPFHDEIKRALRFGEEMSIWEEASLRLRAIESIRLPLRRVRHTLRVRRCHVLRLTSDRGNGRHSTDLLHSRPPLSRSYQMFCS